MTFDFATSETVRLAQRALRMNTWSGGQICLYPGFLMVRDAGSDFALIEYSELDVQLKEMGFMEEGMVPPDAEIAGHTWKHANKDRSPDLRFKDNYEIPIAHYAGLELKTVAGLHEEFHFSHYQKGRTFVEALTEHERTLAALAKSDLPPPFSAAMADDEGHDAEAEAPHTPAIPNDRYVFDRIALGLIVVVIAVGGNWTLRHGAEIGGLFHPPPTVEAPLAPTPAEPIAVAPPAQKSTHRHLRKAHHAPPPSAPAQSSGA